jgi:hypothetical protein
MRAAAGTGPQATSPRFGRFKTPVHATMRPVEREGRTLASAGTKPWRMMDDDGTGLESRAETDRSEGKEEHGAEHAGQLHDTAAHAVFGRLTHGRRARQQSRSSSMAPLAPSLQPLAQQSAARGQSGTALVSFLLFKAPSVPWRGGRCGEIRGLRDPVARRASRVSLLLRARGGTPLSRLARERLRRGERVGLATAQWLWPWGSWRACVACWRQSAPW